MYSFILRLGMSGEWISFFKISVSRRTMRSSSDLDRASPIDLIRSRNSLDWEKVEVTVLVPRASSRPIFWRCSIDLGLGVFGYGCYSVCVFVCVNLGC